jgi:acyl-CoA thioesterase
MARESKTGTQRPNSKPELAEIRRHLRRSVAGRLFGFELISIGNDRAVLSMLIRGRHRQIHGVVHGGILAAIADTAGAMAVYPMLPRATRLATIEMKINYLEPLDRGRISVEARVLRLGQNTAVVECEVRDPDGSLAAKALMTFAVMRRRSGGRARLI